MGNAGQDQLTAGMLARDARRAAVEIVRTLVQAGHTAYFAGGCVRDELLGLAPEDYDVATDAAPDRLATLFKRTALVGASFGVVLVKFFGISVEVATFRSDGTYTDKRRPDSITFSDPKSDAQRRDYTVNALFLDPLGDPCESALGGTIAGRVIDYVGGLPDLRLRLLRAVGDPERRLAEDHLRALRAVRLAAKLGFEIEPTTAASIGRHAKELEGVSRERIGDELRRIMSHPSRGTAVQIAGGLGLDGPILMEASISRPPALLAALANTPGGGDSLGLCLAAWAIDRGFHPGADELGPLCSRYRRALCLSNEETESLKSTLEGIAWIEQIWDGAGVAPRKRFATSNAFRPALVLTELRKPELAARVVSEFAVLSQDGIGIGPAPLVTGDLLIASGLQPGPAFKRILDTVYDAQLEGKVRTREEGLELARGLGV